MHRSTRLRRLIVAFLVVIALAIAVRFARAGETAEARDRTLSASLSSEKPQIFASDEFLFTMGLLG